MITSVVFDLDGTLVDSAPDLQAALNATLEASGYRGLRLDEVTAIVGDGAAVLVSRALALSATPDVDVAAESARLLPSFLAEYEASVVNRTRPYPGVDEALARLNGLGLALGVCTNKPERATRLILGSLELDRHFRAILGGDSLGGIRKPDPRHLMAAIELLGGSERTTVMVGDSANDVRCARALGVPVILRAGGYGPTPADELGGDAVIHEFAELHEAIGRLP